MSLFREVYTELGPAQQAAVNILVQAHNAGLLLPILLAARSITPSEYAYGVFIAHLPYLEQSEPTKMESTGGKEPVVCRVLPQWDQPEESYARIRSDGAQILEYLSFFDVGEVTTTGVRETINLGESYQQEFKSTLRWNLKADKKDAQIEHACLKTITAFLNSGGGRLLVGVRDDGAIEGIESDGFPNEDKFAQHFWNLIKSSLGTDITAFIRGSFEKVDDKTIFVVDCQRSPSPVFLNQKGFDEEFYIRIGPSSSKLGIMEALQYIKQRFNADS